MQAEPGPAYDPRDWTRGYSREQIVAHVGECLELYAELDAEHSIDAAIAPSVYASIQAMVAAVEPTKEALAAAQAKLRLGGDGAGLGLVGRG